MAFSALRSRTPLFGRKYFWLTRWSPFVYVINKMFHVEHSEVKNYEKPCHKSLVFYRRLRRPLAVESLRNFWLHRVCRGRYRSASSLPSSVGEVAGSRIVEAVADVAPTEAAIRRVLRYSSSSIIFDSFLIAAFWDAGGP